VRYGEIYGLLGANGAGKTTTIKMLCGLLDPPPAAVCNWRASAAACVRAEVRQRIGYMSQKFSLYDDLTIGEPGFLRRRLWRARTRAREKKKWVLEFSGLEGKSRIRSPAACPAAGSSAWRSARPSCTSPACCFSTSRPRAWIPLARRAFWRMINRLADMRHRDSGDHALSGRSRAVQSAGLHGGGRTGGRRHAHGDQAGRAGICWSSSWISRSAPPTSERADGALARVAVRRPAARDRGRRCGAGQSGLVAKLRDAGVACARCTREATRSKTSSSRWWRRPGRRASLPRGLMWGRLSLRRPRRPPETAPREP
jgi:hypothetical protein